MTEPSRIAPHELAQWLLKLDFQVDLTVIPDELGPNGWAPRDLDGWRPTVPDGDGWVLWLKTWTDSDGMVAIWAGRRPPAPIDTPIGASTEPGPFKHMLGRAPFIIGGKSNPYLKRWWVIPRNRLLNIYLHQFLRSDDDRALHDHPWRNVSILLRGAYREWQPGGVYRDRRAPAVIFRGATAAHRIELFPGGKPVWTLFITGRKLREWGFFCPAGWRHWREFTAPHDSGDVGRGCE